MQNQHRRAAREQTDDILDKPQNLLGSVTRVITGTVRSSKNRTMHSYANSQERWLGPRTGQPAMIRTLRHGRDADALAAAEAQVRLPARPHRDAA